ncbi:nephrin [Caerostris extrusa]|uniref:Nephrin n=1 Tax=Caerostris extrusa TaxID=172846 RepID=A0AAV4N8D0_CAEEX|nr:nephrin [Caerostris extrusa]
MEDKIVKSTLTINPSPDADNTYSLYSCEAESASLSEKLSTWVLVWMYYVEKPLARLVWTKNGEFIDHSYSTSDWEAENEISFLASSDDDKAMYTCTASSIMTPEPMVKSANIKSTVCSIFSVMIKAQKEAKPGDVISATCKTERSNPASEITWVVDGIRKTPSSFTCYAVNQELGETIPQTLSVSILYAPDPPNIFDILKGMQFLWGNCSDFMYFSRGKSSTTFKWYKGDEEISSSEQIVSGNIVSKELAIIANANDNGANYHCKSSSKSLI